MKKLPKLIIKDQTFDSPIIMGGMGPWISNPLVKHLALAGMLGFVSSAFLQTFWNLKLDKEFTAFHAAKQEIKYQQKICKDNPFGINIMVALQNYEETIRGTIESGVPLIVSGAGLPKKLPKILADYPSKSKKIAIGYIVSSLKAHIIMIKIWAKYGCLPDFVVVEGPLAGGHNGFPGGKGMNLPQNQLDVVLQKIVKYRADNSHNYAIIAAGGISTHQDIIFYLKLKADGVQIGTRFAGAAQSGASPAYKNAAVRAQKGDIICTIPNLLTPASPCGLPFQVHKDSPGFVRKNGIFMPPCKLAYVKKPNTLCLAQKNPEGYFCICGGLAETGAKTCSYQAKKELGELWTMGPKSVENVTKILSVAELISELHGETIAY